MPASMADKVQPYGKCGACEKFTEQVLGQTKTSKGDISNSSSGVLRIVVSVAFDGSVRNLSIVVGWIG